MNILFFCSANNVAEKYTKPAKELAGLIAKQGHNLIWGASDTGLMKEIADSAQESDGKIIGITFEKLKTEAKKSADEIIVTKDLSERKALMLARADIIVALPGGIGTLDEIAEVLELKKHNFHKKPILILNSENFYQGLITLLKTMKDEGFVKQNLDDLIFWVQTPASAMDFINSWLKTQLIK